MARFSAIKSIGKSQAELDFVDVDTSTDTPLYLDPYAIQIRDDQWSTECGDHIRSFFDAVLTQLRKKTLIVPLICLVIYGSQTRRFSASRKVDPAAGG